MGGATAGLAGLGCAACAAAGVHLLYGATVGGRRDLPPLRGTARQRRQAVVDRAETVLGRAGLDVRLGREVGLLAAAAAVGGGLLGLAVFAAPLPALLIAGAAAAWPPALQRARHNAERSEAQRAWPRLIAEVRVRMSHGGRSVPQALFEAGRQAPPRLREAFDAAEREWLLSTDLDRALDVLRARAADATADAACETLLVAHEVGGTDVDQRLAALIEDRTQDVEGRRDAVARQAGVKFARRFVLLVPAGMAGTGLAIGTGRSAYGTAWGQGMVTVGVVMVLACWLWAGRLMRLPEEKRVLVASTESQPEGGHR